jgi:Zinc carboxypeptidase
MGEEGLKEVYQWLDDWVAQNKGMARKEVIGRSPDHWDIPAIFITNEDVSNDDKQIAVITLGRHGQELGTRVVGPEIIHYLCRSDAEEIRKTQVVIVVPVVNPEGFVLNEFCSSRTSLTKAERLILGRLFKKFPPDMMMDFHSLGKSAGSKHDQGDMEVIIPANTTRWAMDEQIHQNIAREMQKAAESEGWPYEIHTLEDLATYYFGDTKIGNMPWSYLKEKVYLLHMQDSYDNYDTPEEDQYTNYTCGPAYLKWHTLVFGMETNHYGLSQAGDIASSGLAPCSALLKMGSTRLPWERDKGYPVNILHGDFRISIRPLGKNVSQRRASRIRIWNERNNFNLPQREMVDQETTLARVRYFGRDLPMEFALCLRMRENNIKSVTIGNKEVGSETFRDNCSTFVHIPIIMEKAGTIEIVIKHPAK